MIGKGFDKIIICENNDEKGERISDIINDENIFIENYIGVSGVQPMAYTDMFLKYRDSCDWLFYCDCDEFLMLDEKYNGNVKNFLNEECFKDVDIIRVNWKLFSGKTENCDLDVVDGNYNVIDRFKDEISHEEQRFSKSFIKTDIEYINNTKLYGHGYFDNPKLLAVNELGEKCLNSWSKNTLDIQCVTYKRCWLNHYPTKTIGEFTRQKMFRGGANKNAKRYNNDFQYWLKYNTENEDELKYGRELAVKYAKNFPSLLPGLTPGAHKRARRQNHRPRRSCATRAIS